MKRAAVTRLPAFRVACTAILGVAMMSLTACSSGSAGGSSSAVGPSGPVLEGRTDLATQQACRQRANEMYEQRNRADLYAANQSANTPFSGNSYVGVPSRGLSGQFEFDRTVADCERSAGSPAPSPAPAVKSR